MGDKTRGLFGKFNISRTDGSDKVGSKHQGCEYFVLDATHDPIAIVALRAYADAAVLAGYELLAADLEKMIERGTLRRALEESVKLQSHYAKLLNMHDGGTRLQFENASAWLDRLAFTVPDLAHIQVPQRCLRQPSMQRQRTIVRKSRRQRIRTEP